MDLPVETNNQNQTPKYYGIVAVLLIAAFGLGYGVGEGRVKVESGKLAITRGDVPNNTVDYSLLWNTLDLLNTKFVDRPLDQQKLMYGAVAGLVSAAGDPYTLFFNPDEAKSFTEQLKGSFDGIGAEVGVKDNQIVIIAPLEDTPASRAGLLAGDAILAINGESTSGMAVDQAVSKIRGPAATTVKLTILHLGKHDPQEISITRAKIVIKSVKLETKEVAGKKIAVVKINQFGDDTKGLLDHVVDTIVAGSYSGVIIDLRNNPGGYLETAVSTISNWVDAGQVAVKEIGFGKSEKVYSTAGVPRLKGIKTIIIANGGSASASEIVAGALQDYKVATVVGVKTFGKGSVQELQEVQNNSEVKITVAKWFTPKGRGIDKKGLEPDIKVELTPDDAKNNKDPQMDKALELLK